MSCLTVSGEPAYLLTCSGSVGEEWVGLTFPTLPLSANCWQSTFTNVISFNLLNNPVKLGLSSCFTDEATEAQIEARAVKPEGTYQEVAEPDPSLLSPQLDRGPAGSSLVSPPDLALQGSLL